jgi:HK97 family phage major capsid protein
MPIPKPTDNEKQADFISRCMHALADSDPDRPNEQRLAMCFTAWRSKHPGSAPPPGEKSLKSPALYRSARIENGTVDADKRLVSFSFSSRMPVRRKLGDRTFREVLSHAPGAIDTARLDRQAVPLLWNHDFNQQIGKIVSYSVSDGKGRAVALLSRNPPGEEALRDIQDGIKTEISAGYIPRAMRLLGRVRRRDEDDDNGDDDNGFFNEDDDNGDDDDMEDLYEVSRWEPVEMSLVSVPADPSVGVNRGEAELYEVRMLGLEGDDVVPDEAKVNLERSANLMADPVTPSPTPPQAEVPTIDVVKIRESELIRIREIQAFGQKFNAGTEAEEFIRTGKTVADFTGYILREKMPAAGNRPIPTAIDSSLGFTHRDRSTYSVVRGLNNMLAAMQGKGRFDGLEAEVSAEMARIHGTEPTGFYVPDWALTRDLTVSPPSTGGVSVQTTVEPSLIPLLRNRTAVLQAGARYISGLVGNLSMPRQNAPATVSWNTEIAPLTESDLKLDNVVLSPNRVGGWCNYSKQLLAQSSLDIENIVRDDLIQIIQIAIDNVALNGTGANQPTGIFNMAANPGPPTPPYDYTKAAPPVAFGSGYPTWAQVISFESAVETGNLVLDDTAAYITSPQVKGAWKGYAKSDPRNTSIWFPAFFWEADNTVNGHRAIPTNQITGNRVVFGKWNELMIGQWAGLDLVVDIYSLATQAEVRVIANMFVDVKYRYTSAFSCSTNSGVSN